jgi:flagellar biosynthesis protein FlhG
MTGSTIIAIASGKGGVGKTWLAITLAGLIARAGHRTLLFDGDIGLANVDVQLGLMPQRDLGDVILKGAPLADIVIPYAPQFDIIAGRSGSGSLSALQGAALEALCASLQSLAMAYDFVLLDLSAGIEEQVKRFAVLADRLIVVATDEPTSLTDAYAFIKQFQARKNAGAIDLVINQATSQKEGEQTYALLNKACMNFLHFSPPCLGVIRRDGKVKDAIRHQSPLLTRAPLSTAAADAAQISIRLMKSGRL